MINSYPSIFTLGHRYISELLKSPVIVEEKVDGSQFSFKVHEDGGIECRSKGADLNLVAPEGMFVRGINTVKELASKLTPNWVYRAEYLQKPKHNSLAYNRIPEKHLIVFDINSGLETYLSYEEKKKECERIGLEIVPILYSGLIEDENKFLELLDTESCLGGQKIEGVVIKPMAYELFGQDKKVLLGKFVSEHFKEVHRKEWKENPDNLGSKDFVQLILNQYRTPARWQKALIHLEEKGLLQSSPKDIGLLMKEVPEDVLKECAEEIKESIFQWVWPQFRRGIVRGLPEWYKDQLLKKQFSND